ncbi:hypothetical protein ACRALDRAFT_2109081 [Sodiomyces alcalophilus JCM 7366]|uniref:uncharacterized protein n=1 Tax=Sodiomyces alcalophilus JCM 7366 TaxID=591952 RepID=UPI0039B48962
MLNSHGSRYYGLLLALSNVLIPISILIFATGFFPYKPFLPGLAQFEELEYGPPPVAQLIRRGHALPFTANARSPTITMPRIKAITTGSIPSFLDVILNFDEADKSSTLSTQDTWLAQMKSKASGKLVMYGDDTWLKLFPDTFDRADGTSSFFVSDYTEVDNNVTRHLPEELQRDDWSAMVLHYLGLDHIGHKAGPRSPNMLPKQREMDGIVQQVYEAIVTREHLASTLLVFCGDHGMNDAGNHGASSPGETSSALVFVSPKLEAISRDRDLVSPAPYQEDFNYYTKVEQSDIAATLAALLGFPVPQNNLGALIVDFLPFWTDKNDQIQLLLRNARQILNIVIATFGASIMDSDPGHDDCLLPKDDIQELACEWKAVDSQRLALHEYNGSLGSWVSAISKWLSRAQDLLSSMASNYNMSRLVLGQALALAAFIIAALFQTSDVARMPSFALASAHSIMMFASSYVEEEHHFWYWATSAWLALLGVTRAQRVRSHIVRTAQFAAAIVATRLIRGWNQTGQKHAGKPDIVTSFLITSPLLLWTLVGATYLSICFCIYRRLAGIMSPGASAFLVPVLGLSAATFKISFTYEDAPELVVGVLRSFKAATEGLSLVSHARVVFAGLGMTAAYGIYYAITKRGEAKRTELVELLHHLYTLLAVTQSRAANIPLFLLFQLQFYFLSSLHLDTASISVSSIMLQHMSFFALGGTNAISSVDLSSAYNGVSGFNVVVVGILTFISNWAGPVYWTSATNLLLLKTRHDVPGHHRFRQHAANLSFFATCSVAAIMAACTVLRTHLFVWTVFSPKYLYCMAWNVGQHLIVNILLAGGLFSIGASD